MQVIPIEWGDCILESSDSEKYLRVLVSKLLNRSSQSNAMANRAYVILGCINKELQVGVGR